jgi:hypothetical protein
METNDTKILTPRRVFGRALSGVAYGCTWLIVVGLILDRVGVLGQADPGGVYTAGFTEQALFSMLVGVGWVLPTLVYENERLGLAPKVAVHLIIGCGVFVPVAIHLHWFPPVAAFSAAQIAGMILAYAGACVLIWFLFYLYFRGEARQINRKLLGMRGAGRECEQ